MKLKIEYFNGLYEKPHHFTSVRPDFVGNKEQNVAHVIGLLHDLSYKPILGTNPFKFQGILIQKRNVKLKKNFYLP